MRTSLELQGKHVVVIGTKRSGTAAIKLLLRKGALVRAMDAAPEAIPGLDIPVVPQTPEYLLDNGNDPDLIVLSPAVPYDLPLLSAARERGVAVIGEVELASYFLQGPIIGITGANGKTTTTALTGYLLTTLGLSCQVGGNIGKAVASMTDSSRPDQWNVLEISSFQLETISKFRADIAACLNVTPDHLDRHKTFENYAAAKARLFETQEPNHHAVLNLEDAVCRSYADRTKAQVHWFSSSQPVTGGVWSQDGHLCWGRHPLFPLTQIKLRGLHNVENVMAACLIALLAGAEARHLGDAVASFPGVEHRIEYVRTLHGVDYFNDSKATNVDACLKAIHAFDGPLWIILGGKDKGSDYSPLREALSRSTKGALLIGAEPPYPHAGAPLIAAALNGVVPAMNCGTMAEAVRYARRHAIPGDTVLLSPACASFDQFQNYEERGTVFKQVVQELF